MRLARALIEREGRRGVVVNADSQQVYRDLRILSARPTAEEMGGIEHRLFGTWDGAQACSAADWSEAARRTIAELHAEDAVPILCGGTGLYLRTLLEGIAPVPEIDPEIRSSVRNLSTYELRERVAQDDPESAERLGHRDIQRMARALEVVWSTGHTLGYWQQRKVGGIGEQVQLHPLILLPDRAWLYARCDLRFERMLRNGAITEVERLMKRGLDPSLPVMRAIGVPEIIDFIRFGNFAGIDAHVRADGQAATRRYAKRQYTWFRRQPPQDWMRVESYSVDITRQFASLFLS